MFHYGLTKGKHFWSLSWYNSNCYHEKYIHFRISLDMFIIKLFILLFIFHFHYSSLVGCFFQLATCGPAGFCTLCWWNWIQTLFQKFWTLFQRFCWWNWIETLSQKFWTLSQRLGALFQRLLFCFCALFQRLFVVQPFSKGSCFALVALVPFSKGFLWCSPFPKAWHGSGLFLNLLEAAFSKAFTF